MKNRSTLTSLLVSMPLFAALVSPAVAFDEGDLEGTWFGVAMYVRTISTAPWITEYQFDINASGLVSGSVTYYKPSEPKQEEVIGGGINRLDITSDGVVEGSVRPGEYFEIIPELQMNGAADFMVGIEGNKDDSAAKIFLFAKSGGPYEVADLEGKWKIAGYAEHVSGAHGAEKITGEVELDDEGGLVEAGSISFGGQAGLLIPGTLNFQIDAGGGFDTSPDLGGDFLMQLAEGKTLAIGRAVGWEDGGRAKHQVYVFVKTAAGAVGSDMAGDWVLKRFSDKAVENDPGVMSGSIHVDEAGTSITGGDLEVGASAEWTVEGGGVETDDQGGVALGDITYLGSDVVTTAQVDLEAGRGVFAGHATDSDGRIALIVGVPEPDTVLLGLVSLAVLFALRRRSFPSFTAPRI